MGRPPEFWYAGKRRPAKEYPAGHSFEGDGYKWEVLRSQPPITGARWWCRCLLCNDEERSIENGRVCSGTITRCKMQPKPRKRRTA